MFYGILSWILTFSHTTTGAEVPTDRVAACDWANRQELSAYNPVVELFVVDAPTDIDRTIVYYSSGAGSEAAADIFLDSLSTLGWPVLKQFDATLPTNCPVYLKIGAGNIRGPLGGVYLGLTNWRNVFADRVALAAMAVAKVPEE